jgi:hypothetical protein
MSMLPLTSATRFCELFIGSSPQSRGRVVQSQSTGNLG